MCVYITHNMHECWPNSNQILDHWKFATIIILLKFSLKTVLWLPFSALSWERELPLALYNVMTWYITKQCDLREVFQLEMTTYLSITFCFLLCLPLSLPSGYLAFRLNSNQNFDLFILLFIYIYLKALQTELSWYNFQQTHRFCPLV